MDNDYKHFIEDFSNLYLGGRLSYSEIFDNEEIPFKLRAILMKYMIEGIDPDTTIENHLFFIDKSSMAYYVYKKLRAKFVLNIYSPDGHGKGKPGYRIKEYEIDEVLDNPEIMAHKDTIFLQEIRVKKLKLLSVTV